VFTQNNNKIYAFIDSQNLNLGVGNDVYINGKKIYVGWKLDFKKFLKYLKDKFRVEKAYLFIGQVPGNEKLYTKLQEDGYILVFKPTLEIRSGNKVTVKGNVDAELVLHTMINFNEFEGAVIVSGDGDFHCLIEYLEEKKKLHKLVIPNKASYSSLLRKFSKYFDFVSVNKKKLEYREYK
jgi:uncharacterized LabA/DUF88 family protein